MGVNGVLKHLFNFVNSLGFCHVFVGAELWLKVACGFYLAVFVPEIVAGKQAVNVLKKGFRRNRVLERKIGVKSARIEAFYKVGVFKDTFDFACVNELAADLSVVHRLDSEEVARNEQTAVNSVVDCKAEHASELGKHVLSPLFKAVNKHLTVRLCIELMASFNKSLSDFLVVVNLAVKGENQGFVLVVNRLMT